MAKLAPYTGCRRSPGGAFPHLETNVKILWPLLTLGVTISMAMSTWSGHAFS